MIREGGVGGWPEGCGPWRCLHPQPLVPYSCPFCPSSAEALLFHPTLPPLRLCHKGNKGLNYVKCFHFHLAPKVSIAPVEMLPDWVNSWI